jgi:hypothetical protein
LYVKQKTIICSLGLATEMTEFIPGSGIGTKIRVSNGKKTYKHPGREIC